MMSFARKAVIITGACSGIGKEAAITFAKDGAKLMITGTDKTQLSNLAKECRTFEGCDVHHITADLSKFDTLKSIIDETVDKYQRIDVLVNNAERMPMSVIPADQWLPVDKEYLFNTTVKAPIFLSQFALPHLKKSKGCVVNVSLPRSESYIVGHIPYCLTRIAVSHFMKRFAAENASFGVRVDTVDATEPTSMNESGSEIREFVKTIPWRGFPIHQKQEIQSSPTSDVHPVYNHSRVSMLI